LVFLIEALFTLFRSDAFLIGYGWYSAIFLDKCSSHCAQALGLLML
jgi:hypothetical protein